MMRMKLALIGNGAMGRLVAALAGGEGHEVGTVVGSREAGLSAAELAERLRGHDAAVDFTVAEAVARNAEACALAGVPLVEGTTGWQGRADEVRGFFEREGGAMIYGANFSVGVQVFYRVVGRAAELLRAFDYEPVIEEAHHSRKRDAPSGTALRLREIVFAEFGRDFSVASTRAGHIPGTHRVGFDAAADQLVLTHAARSREGFAAGALVAARWIRGRRGVYEFSETFDDILKSVMGDE
jgi:4-hydroxy-tetrahydrodipicolinate reductase